MTLSGVIRDQAPAVFCDTNYYMCSGSGSCGTANGGLGFSGTDFELTFGTFDNSEKGLVGDQCNASNIATCGRLGSDNTPVYAYPGMSPGRSVHSPASFYTWFHDTEQTVNVLVNLTLTRVNNEVYTYANSTFFPLDGQGWGDHCWSAQTYPASYNYNHNYAYCFEVHSRFKYEGGEEFGFIGDDDVWVYINKNLVLDLGGLHGPTMGTVYLDQILGLVKGNVYPFDFFYCERHTVLSDIQITTSLNFFCEYYDWCGVCQGNGQSCCTQDICDDNNVCTDDSCPVQTAPQSPADCIHTNIECPGAPDQCHAAGCSPITGCVITALNCNDANECTTDSCDPAVGCQHVSVPCDDQNECTYDSCSPSTGCEHVLLSCDDNNACTNDSCSASTGCAHTPFSCNDGNACTTDSCSPSTGCAYTSLSCNDNNACTTDSCSPSSGCTYTDLSCNDNNACTSDSCSPSSGCAHVAVSCNDQNACTTDACHPASGCAHASVSCNDGNACTVDSCNKTSGCAHNALTCNDNNACTADSCSPTTGCQYASTISCDDKNACTADYCSPSTGCYHTAISCDDKDACTVDSCNVTSGCAHTILSCDDGNACTSDSCDAVSGCKSSPISCDDSNACTEDSCDPIRGCKSTLVSCDDDNACTADSCSSLTGCKHTDVSCNDGDVCTIDSCNTTTGCVRTAVSCDDSNACTQDSCDSTSGCEHSSVTCDLPTGVLCKAPVCVPTSGCQYSPQIDAKWVSTLTNSWVQNGWPQTQWIATLHTGNIALYSVTFQIEGKIYNVYNSDLNEDGLYIIPLWQYQDGIIPSHSSYVSFGYTMNGTQPANMTLSPGICAPEYEGCIVQISNNLVNSWSNTPGIIEGQYFVEVTNAGTSVIAHVNVKISPPNDGVISETWNLIPDEENPSEYECQLWNLAVGSSSQACGYNVNYTSAAPTFDVTNIDPICVN